MGYVLKEALKVLCGVNQWSYAVFWKIGCQNPKLLIWEECFYGSMTSPAAPHNSIIGIQGITSQKLEDYYNGAQVGDKVHLLVEKMMMTNHVTLVGEGLVGRAAFSGNHQWIALGNFSETAHPAEVLNEVRLQFAAGMQTIAVIPVIPHGVVQLGSSLSMMENVGFVRDVRSLILQLGCVPSAFISDNYVTKDAASMFGLPVADVRANPINLPGNPAQMNSSTTVTGSFNLQRSSYDAFRRVDQSSNSPLSQFQDNLQASSSTFMMPNLIQDLCKSHGDHYAAKISSIADSSVLPPSGLVENKNTGDGIMPLKQDSMINQPTSDNAGSRISCPQSSAIHWNPTILKQLVASNDSSAEGNNSTSTSVFNTNKGHIASLYGSNTGDLSAKGELDVGLSGQHCHSFQLSTCNNMVFHDADPSMKEVGGLLKTHQLHSSSIATGVNHGNYNKDNGHTVQNIPRKAQDIGHDVLVTPSKTQEHMSPGDVFLDNFCSANQAPPSKNPVSGDIFLQLSAGEDLFDVLGVDLKNKLLHGKDKKHPNDFCANTRNHITDLPKSMNLQYLESEAFSDYEGISKSGVLSLSGSDHLLEAMISGVSSATRQISDDNVSCRTTASKISSSSVPSTPHSNPPLSGLFNMSDRMQEQLYGLSKPMVRFGEPTGASIRSACGKNDGAANFSLTSSTYGSQISSWVEQGPSTSVSTANSKKPDGGKSNRKRLKPGENPRPRPKDRQMIQDRVKELREIVPNGAKCSIDALLERTIKHMLFLQSVTKHADKLKQTVESKITNKEGGMLLKDTFEGGATWAFELGSQSMVCPIVVEDLNRPRQLLIELLCEERGFFLEIADIIRGLGLTILKGVMEARNDKIWARFAVEANRDVTRMEVFMSLVHLLEQTMKNRTASVNGPSDENMTVHPASMPVNQQPVAPIVCGEPSVIC